MIKTARNTYLATRTWKIFVFSLFIFSFELRILIFFPFSRFRVTWPGNRVRKNLPIDSEILILNFEPLYGLLYIKRKLVICRTQKYTLKSNSKIVVKIPLFFAISGQNDHFALRWAKVVMWHSIRKRMSSIFQRNHFHGKKSLLGATSGKINFLKNFVMTS